MTTKKTTAYVLGGYFPNGGTYMAYHLGRILHRHFGFTCRMVTTGENQPAWFEYPDQFEAVSIAEMEKSISSRDILIVNPSFSHHQLGTRLKCRKLMYIQHFNTYPVIDGFCDYRVCVSRVVQQYIKLIYEWDLPVIPAFIHTEHAATALPWYQRPENKVLVYGKHFLPELESHLRNAISRHFGTVEYELVHCKTSTHREFRERFGQYRYVLALSPCEGFGLPPLEAMAAGCTVIGFHAGGSLEYMKTGVNCEAVCYPRIEEVADRLVALLRNPDRAHQLAVAATATAKKFDYATFERHWVAYLRERIT